MENLVLYAQFRNKWRRRNKGQLSNPDSYGKMADVQCDLNSIAQFQ